MATQAQIEKHQKDLELVVENFERDLDSLLDQTYRELATLGVGATRLDVVRIFQPIRDLAEQSRQELDKVLASNIETNSDVLPQEISSQLLEAVDTLKQQTVDKVVAQIDQEQSSVIDSIVLAGIGGAVATDLIGQTRDLLSSSSRRISGQFATATFQFDTVITKLRGKQQGIKRYRYAGGTIDTTRDFCKELADGIFTEEEIQDIWRGDWGGKAPGDPFVVRGGYNCRHFWVPVEEE